MLSGISKLCRNMYCIIAACNNIIKNKEKLVNKTIDFYIK